MPDAPSLNHLIRPLEERRRDGEAEGLGGLQVDHQLVVGRLLDREIAWLRSLEDLVDVERESTVILAPVGAIGHEAAALRKRPEHGDRRKAMLERKVGGLSGISIDKRGRKLDEGP